MQLRNYMPKTLFGRMLGIILVPMILVQIVTVFIFYERHWDWSPARWPAAWPGKLIMWSVRPVISQIQTG